ncbi:hypothetical protein BDN71DRAFT_1454025 [Pleurotus eryngii]|uniref:Uncharacterized protein n=1 Tax=Pleurotus eryngii TaxID=5323 RepID=A0A9P5ZNC5_PLEER|nr:hypothetical protein BDN71DRAFT_1454025 [Pleurotus eryngii]
MPTSATTTPLIVVLRTMTRTITGSLAGTILGALTGTPHAVDFPSDFPIHSAVVFWMGSCNNLDYLCFDHHLSEDSGLMVDNGGLCEVGVSPPTASKLQIQLASGSEKFLIRPVDVLRHPF